MRGPTRFRGIVRNTSNIPEFLVYCRFLDSSDTAKIQTSVRGGGASSIDGDDSSTMVGRDEA
jgi:hypothetical protein